MAAGNCDTFYGNLILEPRDNVRNLEAVFGSLHINETLMETSEFPKLTRISASKGLTAFFPTKSIFSPGTGGTWQPGAAVPAHATIGQYYGG